MNKSKRNLLIGYSISILLLVVSAIASYLSIKNLMYSSGWVDHTNNVITSLDKVYTSVKEGEAGQRGYLLTVDDRFINAFDDARQNSIAANKAIAILTIDNEAQQADVAKLTGLIEKRFDFLQSLIMQKKRTGEVGIETLESGRQATLALTGMIGIMKSREQALLITRTNTLNKFAASTPAFIIIAALLAILVTVFSFFRVKADFEKRSLLQADLEKQNQQVKDRIRTIENISTRIAAGDFTTRVEEADRANLGPLAHSFDKMAGSLQTSFNDLADNEWKQKGMAKLNEIMIGEKNPDTLAYRALEYVTAYTGSNTGVFYLVKNEGQLNLSASVAADLADIKKEIQFGDGLAGQAALSNKMMLLDNIGKDELRMNIAGGAVIPKSVLAVPISYNQQLKGVIELGSGKSFTKVIENFLETAAFNIGLAVNSARDHERLQALLNETQAQSEELQAQHNEMENINAELEAQAEKLQASEEELKVQQEELQQANGELEERSRMLEEKNEMILERNLDIQHKAEQLELSTKYKSEFLANMSHELRTPLNSILLLSRLLSENHQENLNSDQVEYAGVIQNSGKSLLTLIDEILDLSKIESGKMDLEYASVQTTELTSDLQSLFGPMAKEKGIELHIEKDADVPVAFETDRLRLDQVLRNLLSNALKFTRKGSVSLRIKKQQENIAFSITDTGIGIPADKQQTVFEAFQQADGSTRREFGGTGLGLSISRELAKLLGGSISLKSEEGKGSEFTLTIPIDSKSVAVVHPEEKTELRPATTDSSAEEKFVSTVIPASVADDRETITKNDKRLLIVEDDTAFAKSLLEYIRKQGYKGIVSVRGDEAVALAQQFQPQGILLDVQLPIKSGWEVMDELKANPATRAIPVHMMSSLEVKMKSLSKGAVDFINKPVAFEQVGEMIRKIEKALSSDLKRVLIVEENSKHAQALAYFLQSYNVAAEIKESVSDGIEALKNEEANCVILDMGIPAQQSYETLDAIKKTPGLEQLPIIVFTGKNLSRAEEGKIRQYADSIVVKTAQSYQRILDEVSLFLHLMEENKREHKTFKKAIAPGEVLKDKTILIADDDVRNIFSLTRSLEVHGVKVISAIDGKEALKQLKENPQTDLVLMDMMMPEMDGYQSIQQIRLQPQYRKLPVIAVTAKAMTGDREKCINAGASDYITKPVDTDQLISLLRVWLYNK